MSEHSNNEGYNQVHAEMSDDSGDTPAVDSSRKRDRSAFDAGDSRASSKEGGDNDDEEVELKEEEEEDGVDEESEEESADESEEDDVEDEADAGDTLFQGGDNDNEEVDLKEKEEVEEDGDDEESEEEEGDVEEESEGDEVEEHMEIEVDAGDPRASSKGSTNDNEEVELKEGEEWEKEWNKEWEKEDGDDDEESVEESEDYEVEGEMDDEAEAKTEDDTKEEESGEDESVYVGELSLHRSYLRRLLYQGVPEGQQTIERLHQKILEAKQAQIDAEVKAHNLASKVLKAKKQLDAAIKESAPDEEFMVKQHLEEFHDYCSKVLSDSNSRFRLPALEFHWNPASFDVSEAMGEWYNKFSTSDFSVKDAFPYLFADESCGGHHLVSFSKSVIHAAVASEWHTKVHKEDASLEEYYDGEFKYPCQGTNREFFNRVWNQLGSLKVDGVELFQNSLAGLVPVGYDFFVGKKGRGWYWEYKEQISRYYRAFGRILAHCILLKISISAQALPRLYMTKLFRGMDPLWHSYIFDALIKDVMGIVNLRMRNTERAKKLLLSRLGLEEKCWENERNFRRMIFNKYFGDGTSSFVSNLEDGISLGGKYSVLHMIRKTLAFLTSRLHS
eukprot:Nitzschia sp. Nitz4//scaffold194_size40385//20419//22410//NITZ4_007531-RA/size40385-snap-gene-0.22-mRNA-1//1//CDS//3329540337//8659//frame0